MTAPTAFETRNEKQGRAPMTVVFVPYSAPDAGGQFWRWPEACQQDPDHFTVEMNNRNAGDVLERLGYAGETWLDEPLPIDEFAALVQLALRRSLGKRSPALAPRELAPIGGGMSITDGGRAEGYLESRLFDLAMLAARAREAGATHIGWS
jgi:hypothetical protein